MLAKRRLWLGGLALAALVFSGCDWTLVGYNAANTYSSGDTSLSASSAADLVPAFSGDTGGEVEGAPVVANGVMYVVSWASSSDAVTLDAFDATGGSDCNDGSCPPLWTAALGTASSAPTSSPAAVNGVVYAGSSNNLEAFDAAGETNCSGTPTVCAPLWSASVGPVGNSSPIVTNGVVYIGSTDDDLYAFDAAGETDCSGTPTVCGPLWSADTGGPIEATPSVSNGVAYVGSTDDDFYAFDATGVTDCSGTPTTCSPLWSAVTPGPIDYSAAVSGGIAYVAIDQDDPFVVNNLDAFDATGVTDCSGTPKTCTPMWTYSVETGAIGPPAVADGLVYESQGFHIEGGDMSAYDASGNTDCSGTPKVCQAEWTGVETDGVAIANGVVYDCGEASVGAPALLYEYDATTGQAIGNGPPSGCSEAAPVVANGMVYDGAEAWAPLQTQVLVPSNGSSLSGTTVLDASASPGYSVTGVQFELSGGGISDQVVGTATPTLYGWIAQWDTTTVANGTYTLQSVATMSEEDPIVYNLSVTSPGVTITVNNASS
jgi:hypothetical protein